MNGTAHCRGSSNAIRKTLKILTARQDTDFVLVKHTNGHCRLKSYLLTLFSTMFLGSLRIICLHFQYYRFFHVDLQELICKHAVAIYPFLNVKVAIRRPQELVVKAR